MEHKRVVILFFLGFMFESHILGAFDSLIFLQRFAEERAEHIQIAKQYTDLYQLQKETDFKLEKINEWSKTISEHTGIKLNNTQEAFDFFTNESVAKQQSLDGLLNKDFFKHNPEYQTTIKKVVNGYDLNTSDLAGILDVVILDKDSDALIIRRLQRKGYSKSQIDIIMAKLKQTRELQKEIASKQTSIHQHDVELETYKQMKSKTNCSSLETEQQKNECLANIYKMDAYIVAKTALLLDIKKELNQLVAQNNAMIHYLRSYEIRIDSENVEAQSLASENSMMFLIQQNKAQMAESKLDDFINFTQFHLGRGY